MGSGLNTISDWQQLLSCDAGSQTTNFFEHGWIAAMDLPLWNVSDNDAPRKSHSPSLDRDTRQDNGLRSDPGAGVDCYGPNLEAKCWIVPVMVASTEINALREADIVLECDVCQVVDPTILSNPTMIADAEPPGVFHADAGFDDYTSANLGTEYAQK